MIAVSPGDLELLENYIQIRRERPGMWLGCAQG